jgi:flagellin
MPNQPKWLVNCVQKDFEMASVNTNYGALVALQNLNMTSRDLDQVQSRINTGLKVSSAKDNGAVFAIAEGQRARLTALGAVADGVNRSTSSIDTALAAGASIGDLLKQMKEKAQAAQATDLSSDQMAALQAEFAELRDQVDRIADTAYFNGTNLVNGATSSITVQMSDQRSGSVATVTGSNADGAGFSANATLDSLIADADAFETGDAVQFTFTAGPISGSVVRVAVSATTTVQQYMDAVKSATGGRVNVTFDGDNLVYRGNSPIATEAFTVLYDDADTTEDYNGAFFDANTTADTGTAAANATGSVASTMTLTGYNFKLGGSVVTVAASADISTSASAVSSAIDTSITNLNSKLATLGSQAKAIDTQKSFLTKLSDEVERGIGNLVDADLAKESARLQSLQIKQQLGAQALSIANQAPSILLSFFR